MSEKFGTTYTCDICHKSTFVESSLSLVRKGQAEDLRKHIPDGWVKIIDDNNKLLMHVCDECYRYIFAKTDTTNWVIKKS